VADPNEELSTDLGNLVAQWQELGIDPDAFVTCANCHKIFDFAATADDYTTGNVCGCE
jgi:hypothetical protein